MDTTSKQPQNAPRPLTQRFLATAPTVVLFMLLVVNSTEYFFNQNEAQNVGLLGFNAYTALYLLGSRLAGY